MTPSGDSSAEALQVRRESGIIIFKVMNGKKQNTVPKERARRLVKKLHTQSQNKEQRRTGGGLLFNILPIPH